MNIDTKTPLTIGDQITADLRDWSLGDPEAFERILPQVYEDLHRLARAYLAREGREHTLQATALINEAYLRLSGSPVDWHNRAQFIGVTARVMRRILVDHGRQRRADKRGGDAPQVPLDEVLDGHCDPQTDLLALDQALDELARLDPDQARIVELRYFAGLTIAETATALEISPATVKREWTMARAWLFQRLSQRQPV
ncbi:MAG: sigma-70 family RNA polymerase sigma factor [Acidobacteriota bacterium]